MQPTFVFFFLVLSLHLRLSTATTYPTRDGIYCPCGLGQRRDIGDLVESEDTLTPADTTNVIEDITVRYCPQSKYCFALSTDNVDVVRRNFGETIDGQVLWDAYYTKFYIKGCQYDFDTTLFPTPEKPQRCLTDKLGKAIVGGVSRWTVGHNVTLAAKEGVNPSEFIFKLDYCCYTHYCNGGGRLTLGVGFLLVSALLSSLAMDFFATV